MSNLMDKLRAKLAEDLLLAQNATKGPWFDVEHPVEPGYLVENKDIVLARDAQEQNAQFIAHSRNVFESRVCSLMLAREALEYFANEMKYEKASVALATIAKELGVYDETTKKGVE